MGTKGGLEEPTSEVIKANVFFHKIFDKNLLVKLLEYPQH